MADNVCSDFCCRVCGIKTNLKRCGVCRNTFYCSREHQIQDWNAHKSVCQMIKSKQEAKYQDSLPTGRVTEKDSQDVFVGHNRCKYNIDRGQRSDEFTDTMTVKTNDVNGETDIESIFQFDSRPLKYENFLSMTPEVNDQKVAKIVVESLQREGYCVVDGLFTKTCIKKALKDIDKCEKDNKFSSGKLGGGRTSGEEDQQVVNASIRSDKIMWLEGTEKNLKGFTDIVARMDSILWEFNKFLDNSYFINGRTKAMVACYPGNGSFYRRHVDNPHGDGRVVTCILYLNEGWNVQEDGGFLRILPAESDDYVDVAPVANRLLFFWCDRRNPHEVHPAYKTRYAITVWYMDEEERKRAKRECMLGEVDEVRGETVLMERQKKQDERDKVSQEIEDTASEAIASLSVEELKAMASLIAGHPGAEAVLAKMGIAPNIRSKLLTKLQDIESASESES